ncbi:MAG: universal stress protein [Opitutae bacterium]|nr:universal stress protein [Opitutae bacterium]
MKTFLVPVDFSSVTEAVIDSAVGFARAFAGRVVLLHVVQPPVIVTGEYALPVEVMQDAMTAGENSAKVELAEYHGRLRDAGLDCSVAVRHGPPVEVIHEEATETKADYVIMGSHGHGKLYDFLVGSTASGVLKKAKCGVIIIPPTNKAP